MISEHTCSLNLLKFSKILHVHVQNIEYWKIQTVILQEQRHKMEINKCMHICFIDKEYYYVYVFNQPVVRDHPSLSSIVHFQIGVLEFSSSMTLDNPQIVDKPRQWPKTPVNPLSI